MLITIADIKAVRDISENINQTKRINNFIEEAEQVDVKPVLNACGKDFFYYITLKNDESPVDADIEKLLAGGTYVNSSGETISFNGLRKVIALYAYARIIQNNAVHITATGNVQKNNQYSTSLQQGSSFGVNRQGIEKPAQEARTTAATYFEEVKRFLNDQSDLFPMYSSSGKRPGGGLRLRSVP